MIRYLPLVLLLLVGCDVAGSRADSRADSGNGEAVSDLRGYHVALYGEDAPEVLIGTTEPFALTVDLCIQAGGPGGDLERCEPIRYLLDLSRSTGMRVFVPDNYLPLNPGAYFSISWIE